MHIAMFYHSLVSDWNHGNAHFLRGIATELQARGHSVSVFEPKNAWSRENLRREHGRATVEAFRNAFPNLTSEAYTLSELRIEEWLDKADLVLVHEWNDPKLIFAIGEYRRHNRGIRVLFHDTHHRALTSRDELARFDLTNYDGILAYGASLQRVYQSHGWGKGVHVWHEAADIRTFYPRKSAQTKRDLVWIGNWGDEERTQELREYFIQPAQHCSLEAQVYGVRYPEFAQRELGDAGIEYGGWLANFEVPAVFAKFKATIHVPRRPYTRELAGIPTIRPFEALACGIPLVSAPWQDTEGLFRVGQDFLMARNGSEMESHLRDVLNDSSLAQTLVTSGLETIRNRHTCAHRVDELLGIYEEIQPAPAEQEPRFAEVRA